MNMRLTVILFMTAALGCGDDGGASAPPMDGGPIGDAATMDGGPPFDPDMTYEGEGEPCQMSLECARYQICVDDVCRRHERFEAEELSFGELRVSTPEMLADTAFVTDVTWPWAELQRDGFLLAQEIWHARQVLTSDGPALAFFYPSIHRCQAVVWDSQIRVRSVDGMVCSAIDAVPDGRIALAGLDTETLRARVVVFGPDDAETPAVDVLASGDWDAQISAELDQAHRVALPTSILLHGERMLVSIGVDVASRVEEELAEYWERPTESSIQPRDWALPRVAFAEADPGADQIVLMEVGGSLSYPGNNGWLVEERDDVHALITVDEVDPALPTFHWNRRMDLVSLETGEPRELYRARGAPTEHWRGSDNSPSFAFSQSKLPDEVPAGGCGPIAVHASGDVALFAPSEFVACEAVARGSRGGEAGLSAELLTYSIVDSRRGTVLAYLDRAVDVSEPDRFFLVSDTRILHSIEVDSSASVLHEAFAGAISRFGITWEFVGATTSSLLAVSELRLELASGEEE